VTAAPVRLPLDVATAEVAAGAAARDRDDAGAFPEDAVAVLERAGAFAAPAAPEGPLPLTEELRLLRAVAAADMGVARILDGHCNAVERLRVLAPPDLAATELATIAAGRLRAGVWGADPAPGEGDPARLDGAVLRGTKTFCSGAGGLHRALVLVGAMDGPPLSVYADLTAPGTVEVDRGWFRGAGMRSSASHRVVLHGAPVLAVLGEPGSLAAQPWFARDAVRTAATWAGAADAAADDAIAHLAARPATGDLEALAAGRIRTWQHGLGLWLEDAARALDGEPDPAAAAHVSARTRAAVADAARAILDEGERATGSRPGVTGAPLDRAARDLRLFLRQHRLEPIVARAGRSELEAQR